MKVLSLGNQPICNKFLEDRASFSDERLYPLDLFFCRNCTLVQLGSVPPSEVTFGKGYNYLTGATAEAVRYFHDMALKLADRFSLGSGDYVLDIGSNDGTFLKGFHGTGVKVVGVEPSPYPSALARREGISTVQKRLEDSVDEILAQTRGQLRLITAFNVIAHTDTIHQFLDVVSHLMERNDCIFVSQSHYLPRLIEACAYDTIYHEHARYYTIGSLGYLLRRHGLTMFDAEESLYYGGSIIAYASNRDVPETKELASLKASELSFRDLRLYPEFALRVEENKRKLRKLLFHLRSNGKRIAGIGAPMKSSTLLNYCGIDSNLVDYLTEVNPLKVGSYSPGTHIKVLSEEVLFKDAPEVALILSWNVADGIIERLRRKGYRGQFVIPIPEPRVID